MPPLKLWQKIVGGFAVLLLLGLGYWYQKHTRRMHRLEVARRNQISIKHRDPKVEAAEGVVVRSENPTTLEDEKKLKGRSLWVSAGGQLEYYAYNGRVEFDHPMGVLLGAQRITVQDAVLQNAPPAAAISIPQGDGQVLLVFTLPDAAKNSDTEYAVAVGDKEDSDYVLLTDQIFFYDDPHKLYAKWGGDVWNAIDRHQAMLGMSEHQVQLALGYVSTPRGDIMGDRAVEFDDRGEKTLVTFVKGRAIGIQDIGKVDNAID